MKWTSIRDVVAYQQCCGCGACTWAMPDAYEMYDVIEHGLRPRLKTGVGEIGDEEAALAVCPGIELRHPELDRRELIQELLPAWGPILEVWEGYASDARLRFEGSSGGAATALALYGIEKGGMHGVLHIRAKKDAAHQNQTVLSTTRAELMEATGSRYSPASPCEGLARIEAAPAPCVFIGKPCDVAGANLAAERSPVLRRKMGLTIAIFCAGTPSTQGTLEMLKRMGVTDPGRVNELRYRGRGWPGMASARQGEGPTAVVSQLTYEESWGEVLEKHRQWRCHVCADHTGEFADVAVGDPWYREIPPDEPGRSLILVRTENGHRIVRAALRRGYLTAVQVDPSLVPASQPNLLKTRGAIWGRLATLRACGLPAPRYVGFALWRHWLTELSMLEKARSITGTLRRIVRRKLYRPLR